ncbi:signal peptidase 1, putative [Theileria equi strain WA]|uniref:Signal peptidase complex catalytic subunit SEC11 n=1 Tax=Theileria equi strain WA TaxID=1537102 RepID=L1LCX3_THEEQ|nr:signal peptidase 1, putative [Theileria equi strain WA]EKX73134.1 signal peptidase 1, putative [Theileria equi strain WA]|eukprot:XP_004832586.1 signal peptidase 1, putative [Theileria equi strain WA]
MDRIKEEYGKLRNEVRIFLKRPKEIIEHFLYMTTVIFTALMFWKLSMILTGTDSPIVVVLSGSMEPSFYRGDILFLMKKEPITSGDIVVFKVPGRNIPIVHRAISLHAGIDDLSVLTKGDNNEVHDRGLYPHGVKWLDNANILGTVLLKIPQIGIASIYLNEVPAFKYAVTAFVVFLILAGKG